MIVWLAWRDWDISYIQSYPIYFHNLQIQQHKATSRNFYMLTCKFNNIKQLAAGCSPRTKEWKDIPRVSKAFILCSSMLKGILFVSGFLIMLSQYPRPSYGFSGSAESKTVRPWLEDVPFGSRTRRAPKPMENWMPSKLNLNLNIWVLSRKNEGKVGPTVQGPTVQLHVGYQLLPTGIDGYLGTRKGHCPKARDNHHRTS